MPIISDPKASVKVEHIQETADAPLSKPIASNFISIECVDLGEPGKAKCDKCKLKGAEGGRVEGRRGAYKGEGYMLIACVNRQGNIMVTTMDDSLNQW